MRKAVLATAIFLVAVQGRVNAAAPAAVDVPRVYRDHDRLLYFLDESVRERQIVRAEDWPRRRADIMRDVQAVMGALPDRSTFPPPDVKVTGETRAEGYSRLTLSYVADGGGDRVPATLYLPEPRGAAARRPAVIALHPTSPLGRKVLDGDGEKPNRGYAPELARRGYVVLSPDYPSFGDYANYDFEADAYVSGTMKGIVNHMRGVDLLRDRADVDPERIGAVGHSLGGHNAIFLGVFDERVKAVVSSCGWTPFRDYYGGRIAGWAGPRYMPRLRDAYKLDPARVPFDFPELVAALAPRGFFSNSPLHDDNFDVGGVRKGAAAAAPVFELLGAADALQVRYPDCGHDFPPAVREEAYLFLDKMLRHAPPKPAGDALDREAAVPAVKK